MSTDESRTRRREKQRASAKRWRDENPERAREVARRYYFANKEKRLEALRRYLQKPEAREKQRIRNNRWTSLNPDKIRDKNLRMKYGITLVEKQAMLEAQGGKRALCKTSDPGKHEWATDHDHATKKVRGILCHPCNHLVGRLGDNATSVKLNCERMLDYLALSGDVP